jgi:hypothetical protein
MGQAIPVCLGVLGALGAIFSCVQRDDRVTYVDRQADSYDMFRSKVQMFQGTR